MPIEIVPKRKTDRSRSKDKMKKRMTPKSKTPKTSRAAAPFMMPGQKKMLDKMMGKSKPQTLKGGGGLRKRITSRPKKESEMEKAVRLMNKAIADIPKNVRKSLVKKKDGGIMGLGAGMKAGRKADMQANKKMPDPKPRKNPRGLKSVPEGNKGKGLSKLPTEVRNKMGYMKKGGKVMKMRGGGAATRGLMFNNR